MSDSDDDSLPNNVFTFQNENMTICARGPNVNSANMTASSFRNNAFTSTLQMPVNFGRQRYAGSNFDQRSMYYRRDRSTMSLRSVPDFGPSNFNHSSYRNGIGYPRSVFNAGGGSVISDRSIDSAASVSVADIAFAFKNRKFNRHEMMILKEAYSKLIKSRQRKRIEKRRNMRFWRGSHRKSGNDSSERETDSSISNDDCRSMKSTLTKEAIPGLRNMRKVSHYSANVQKQNENEMFRDCTNSIKQNAMRNMFSNSMTDVAMERIQETSVIRDQNQTSIEQNMSVMSQKERFTKGFLLPSQRFNKSVVGQTQMNDRGKIANTRKEYASKVAGPESDSDGIDEIFHRKDTQQAVNVQRKRTIDTEGICYSDKKKSKLNSPNKLRNSKLESTSNTNCNSKSNDFIFAKPKMPIKKGSLKKDFGTEKLLAKSNVPAIAETDDFDNNIIQGNTSKPTEIKINKNVTAENDTHSEALHSTSDVSMRPSFIKRKLFTQKLDVAENKNASCDSIAANSPQNTYSESMREKNKARKLVTSQSCLSRDVLGEDNNVLDLIHKIVPPDQINITNVANKTESCNNQSNKENNNEKWDVTAIISSGNFQDVSDTYTDEEIFNPSHQDKVNKPKNSVNKLKEVPQCKIVIDKLKPSTLNKLLKDDKNYELPHFKVATGETNRKRVTDCVRSFWDTDFESDVENHVATSWKTNRRKNQVPTNKKKESNRADKLNTSIKKPVSQGILTLRNFHKDQKFNVTAKLQTSVNDKDKQVTDIENTKSVVVEKAESTKVGKTKETKTKSQTGKKQNIIANENVPVTKRQQEPGRTPKSKVCSDCNNIDKPKNTPKKLNSGVKMNKKQGNIENDKKINNNSGNNNKHTRKLTQKSKDNKPISSPSGKQAKKDSSKKTTNSGSNKEAKSQKPAANVRVQPKRKSKEKSFIQSPKPKTNNTKVINNKAMNKTTKEPASKNISLNNMKTRSTRSSTEKLSFNSSGCDKSNMNISNISNRSLRWRQRKINEYK